VPDVEPGDVIVVIKEVPHKVFKRKGADLFMEKEISLLEALTGVDFVFNHLDGRKIKVTNTPGEIIKPE
jgi:DnaJ family protein A protein 2